MDDIYGTRSPIDSFVIYTKHIPKRAPVLSEYPPEMLPEIKEYLGQCGISRLYQHQAEMFSQAIAGNNVVITTSTASGKTMSFLLPVL